MFKLQLIDLFTYTINQGQARSIVLERGLTHLKNLNKQKNFFLKLLLQIVILKSKSRGGGGEVTIPLTLISLFISILSLYSFFNIPRPPWCCHEPEGWYSVSSIMLWLLIVYTLNSLKNACLLTRYIFKSLNTDLDNLAIFIEGWKWGGCGGGLTSFKDTRAVPQFYKNSPGYFIPYLLTFKPFNSQNSLPGFFWSKNI